MNRKLVIDISHWNGNIDLAAWKKKHNLWGVIVKAGGYENLKDGWQQYRDSKFEANYAKAKAAGLHVGVYYYDATTSTTQAKKNSAHFLTLLKGKKFDMPAYMDVEEADQFMLSKRTLTDIIKTFCNAVKSGGYYSGLYTGGSAWLNNMYNAELLKYADWIAAWRASWPTYAGDIGMWQQGSMDYATGAIAYRWVSGYVDVDWCVVDYPSRISSGAVSGASAVVPTSASAVVKPVDTKLAVAERSAQMAEHIAKHDIHGYSQPNRMGYGTETVKFSDNTTFVIHKGDYDCSEMARVCANAGLGIGVITYMWSGDADGKLKAAGFKRLPFSTATVKRGDILWKTKHMGIALGNGKQADAHGDEYGGITGPNQGDQTTHEIEVRDLHTNWTYIYRHDGMPKPKQQPGKAENNYGLYYRAHCETAGWFAAVHDGQVAGTTGYGKRLEAFKITPPESVTLDVLAHIQGVGDKWYRGICKGKSSGTGSSKTDPIIGTVGKSKRIEGIRIDVVKNTNPKLKGKTLYYRVHVQKQGWTKWCKAGTYAGTKGKALRIEAVQIAFR